MINKLLWLIYFSLLAVLLPHTAWAARAYEPPGLHGDIVAWAWAVAFEVAIAVLTRKLTQRLEATPRSRSAWTRFRWQYLNAFALGLVLAMVVSAAANWAHAVEFGQSLRAFGASSLLPGIYAVMFGGILPVVSFVFAWVLSNVAESEAEPDAELEAAKAECKELRRAVRDAEARATAAEERFDAAGDLFRRLFAAEKRERILAAAERWPQLKPAAIAVITETSESWVSEVLAGQGGADAQEEAG